MIKLVGFKCKMVVIIAYSLCAIHAYGALTRSNIIAINTIEKEIASFLEKKPVGWQHHVEMRVKQLERDYVPKGYQADRVNSFKKAISVEVPQQQQEIMAIEPLSKNVEDTVSAPEYKQQQQEEKPQTEEKQPPQKQPYPEKELSNVKEEHITENKDVLQKTDKNIAEQEPQEIIDSLETLLRIPESDRSSQWSDQVNRYIFALSITDVEKAKEYFEKMYHAESLATKQVPEDEKKSIKQEITAIQPKHLLIEEEVPFTEAPLQTELPAKQEQETVEKENITEKIEIETEIEQGEVPPASVPENEFVPVEEVPLVQEESLIATEPVVTQNQDLGQEVPVVTEPESAQAEIIPEAEAEKEKQEEQKTDEEKKEEKQEEQKEATEVISEQAPQQDSEQKVSQLTHALNELIILPIEQKNNAWEQKVNDLIFELSLYDKNKANEYVAKIYVRAGTIPLIVQQPNLPKPGSPPPPPPMPGTIPLPRPAGPPPPPPVPGAIKMPPKAPAIAINSLRKMDNQALVVLFNKHLDELDKQWNAQSEEIIKIKTKHGERTEKIRGVPELSWNNALNTIKKVLIEKEIFSEAEITQKVNEKVMFVRSEMSKKNVPMIQEALVSVEITERDLINQLKTLFGNPQITQMSWLVSVKGAIKKLDAFSHEAALKYQEDYIQLMPKERRFIKP